MTPVADFIKEEESKMSWLEKILMNCPKIYSPKELASSTNGLSIETEKIFRPSFFDIAITVIFLGFSTL